MVFPLIREKVYAETGRKCIGQKDDFTKNMDFRPKVLAVRPMG